MSYKEKYLKYKSKYLNFKAKINNQSGGGIIDIMNVSELSATPTETKQKFIGGSNKKIKIVGGSKKDKKPKKNKILTLDVDSDFDSANGSDSSLKSFSSIETASDSDYSF